MGNLQQCYQSTVDRPSLELDRHEAIFYPDETISGTFSNSSQDQPLIFLIGTIYFKRGRKNRTEKCRVRFLSFEFQITSSADRKQRFEFLLNEHLPPSFNNKKICPNISYSVNLTSKSTPDQIDRSIPVHIYPRMTVDRPLLLTPLFFGPVENHQSGMRLEIKVNRAVFTLNDLIEIFYELQNPQEVDVHQIQISLGVYYLINSRVWQEDVCKGIESYEPSSLKSNLVRNRALLKIPNKVNLPPTYQFQYGREGDRSSFHLNIDYKIQVKVYLQNADNLWQVDIPIVLCSTVDEGLLMNSAMPLENEQLSSELMLTNTQLTIE